MTSSFYHDYQQHPHLTFLICLSIFHLVCFFLITCRCLHIKGMIKYDSDFVCTIHIGHKMLVLLIRMGTLPIVRFKNFSDHIEYALLFVQQYKFVFYLRRLMDPTNRIYCYIFAGGKLVQKK